MQIRATILLAALFCGVARAQGVVFDAHLHYNEEDAQGFAPRDMIEILRAHRVQRALITSIPPQRVLSLHRLDPDRIVPFLGVYRDDWNKTNWFRDAHLPVWVASRIRDGGLWRGIGELHLFAEHRHSSVFRALVELAAQHDLVLLMHADPAVIDTIYEVTPDVTVLWAHAGTYPYPDLLEDYLRRYPRLHVDLSVRDERVAPHGLIADEWYLLFLQHPGRFVVGVDTYSTQRWRRYGAAIAQIRQWLAQLPADVGNRLAFANAARLFQSPPGRGSER